MKMRFLPALTAVFALLIGCAAHTPAPNVVTLDQAIAAAAADIDNGLDRGVKLAVVGFASPSETLSDFVVEELLLSIANRKQLVVVERKELEIIRSELRFQISG